MAFAQVREDPRLDLEVVAELGPAPRVVMIASGGETALCLGRLRLGQLLLVDVNPAQLALVKIKWWLAENVCAEEARRRLGHLPQAERAERLGETLSDLGLPLNALGSFDRLAQDGPDYSGRYERLFAALRHALRSRTLEDAFAEVMALDNLVALFGASATQNPRRSFAEHFSQRTRLALERPDAARNPFLQSILTGCSPDWDWLRDWQRPKTQPQWLPGAMAEVLPQLPPASLDLVHLSNILDWLSPPEAAEVLQRAARVLRRGGRVLVRQLNSSLNIARLDAPFEWDDAAGARLVERDRSYFYPQIHLGRKR